MSLFSHIPFNVAATALSRRIIAVRHNLKEFLSSDKTISSVHSLDSLSQLSSLAGSYSAAMSEGGRTCFYDANLLYIL